MAGGGVKEDEKNERIIRSLLKLPDNKRCINCNSLGPQYVCTTFWTFVCTNCSGIHREFTHRVKSISMAKFTSQEVSALKEGGNQHAKDIYFKGLDQQRQSAPDGSNVERLRDFIRQVYVNKRYTNEKNDDKPPRGPMGDNETRSSSGSRSPPYEDAYERRYSDRSSPGGMSPGFEQGNRKSPSRPEVLNDWRREDRFGGRKKTEEESHSPEQVKDLGSSSPPIARPVREILGDSVIPLRVIEPPKPQVNRNSDSSVFAKPAASSSSLTTTNENPPEVKMETAMSLIDFDADPEPPAPSVAIQAPISATHQPAPPAQPASASNDNWASFDAAPITPSLNVSQPPPSGNSVDSLLSQLAAPSSGPVQTSTLSSGPAHLGHSTSQIFAPPPNGQSNEQPWNTGLSSNVQRSMSAPSLHPLQGVPSEVKSSGRTELPADLFTATYQSYHAAAPGWQAGPPHGMHYGMPYGMQQYNNTMPYQNVPQPARSMNPFDLSSEPPSVTQTETMFPSMASLQGALPPSGMMPSQGLHNHFSMPPQVSGHPSAMPPRYISPQIPGSMPPSSLRPIGNMGAPYDTQQTYQIFGSPFAANSSNPPSFPLGGNPFG
ncbi:hypothetical protein BRARA_D00724 [Brassica rapa]|uniref:Arf-GAP domain-containing protein n=1 Tax=Brassica campestris TaxID=3711 RepID=A0A397ZR43_BRACM|nr:hypothetical protein BRARA_D00724 [Brassica rapa]RID65536.1 hypothetical protein BRARA_D00724 [Brassica rapa]